MPKLYKILGYAGAIPFVFCAFELLRMTQLDPAQNSAFFRMQSIIALTQLAYAGLIASFLSGVHWAHALPKENNAQALLAMIPTILSLVLFIAAGVMGFIASSLLIASIGFKLIFVMDKKFLEPDWLPHDYFKFRMIITLIACTSLLLSAISFWI